ncbi:MAG: pilus assembly protein, partial [Proteobacteria bacterium]|nr:pilus assembly protein [Pseudomonadota bacterium]
GLLWIDSNSQIGVNSAFTTIVANRIRLDSNAQLVINTDYAASDVPALLGMGSGVVRLIE